MSDPRRTRRRLVAAVLPANLIGALLSFWYFTFIDVVGPDRVNAPVGDDVLFFVLGFSLIGGIGYLWSRRWSRVLETPASDDPVERAEVRRRALALPYALAGITFTGWALAGIIWGVVRPALFGTLTLGTALRVILGNTVVAGSVTTAFIFFVAEHRWRKQLATYFPEGSVSAVPGVFKLRVRTRLLVIFLLTGTLPLSLLGLMAYRRSAALLGMDAASAAQAVGNMLVIIVFLVTVGLLSAVGLALFVANSVAGPLREVQGAMAEVARGNLETRCPVVSNDELGAVAEGFNQMVQGLRERELLMDTFGRYVSPEVRDEILSGRLSLEGQVREVTILFADIRDFTPWVEAHDPQEVVRDLNRYFSEMDGAIRRHRGLVLQFIGDEIEAVFGAPVADPAHPEMAVRAALEMRERLARLNDERARQGKPPLRHGVGIHTGRVLAGNIGSRERHSYALVGDPVNLASRLQELNKQFGSDILVSGTARERLDGGFELTPLPAVRVKGKSGEVEVYRLG